MKQSNNYYVYALLDPRKMGNFKYGEFVFNNEPFYIGKGCRLRMYQHFQENDIKRNWNPYKTRKIKKIIREGFSPLAVKIADMLLEEKAFEIEKAAITAVGMKNQGGPLTNLYDGGCGSSPSSETRQKISKIKKAMYANGLEKFWEGKHHSQESIQKMVEQCHTTRQWKLTSPDKEEFIISGKNQGLKKFCQENNLCRSHLISIATGNRKSHKGWKCEYATGI